MTMSSGQRPFDYDRQPFPFIVPADTGNTSGVMNPFSEYGEPYFIFAHHLGQAWFANLAQLRSIPDGHPNEWTQEHPWLPIVYKYPAEDRNCRGIIHVPSGQIDHPQLIAPHIFEPDPSGIAWQSMTARDDLGNVLLEDIPAHIQIDTYGHYISWLRGMMNNIFEASSLDYVDKTMEEMRADYLAAYFPRSSGIYTDPNATEFLDISLAEVQYNPYPRVAGIAPYPHEDDGTFWQFYAGQWGGDVSAEDKDYYFLLDAYLYYDNILKPADYGTNFTFQNYFSRYTWKGSTKRSSPYDDDDYIALSRELHAKFAVIDSTGPVFPACQTLDGRLTPAHSGDDDRYEEPPSEWFVDGGAMGKEPGQYTIDQVATIYNRFSDPVFLLEDDHQKFREFMSFYYWNYPYFTGGYIHGGSPPNIALAEDGAIHAVNDMEPMLYGYEPGDINIGYMAWLVQDDPNSVRIDGEGLIPNLTRLRVCDLPSREWYDWDASGSGVICYATGGYITQSGSREINIGTDARNCNVGSHWVRHPAEKHGFPSHSGEPIRYILDEDFTAVQNSGYIQSVRDRRAWFPMPDCNSPDIARGEQSLNLIEPIFAERRNVKKILIENNTMYNERGIAEIAAPSGNLSVWPSNEDFQNGSGVGYHVMDKGIWIRKHPASCGMQLISPYNGQRLLFKRAEDKVQTWGTEDDVWRIEVRPGNDYHLPEYYYGVSAWRKNEYFRDPYAIKEEITPPETVADAPENALPHNTTLKEFTGQRSYVASWYRNKEEQVPHTDGTYTIFNIAAQISDPDNYKMSREEYLDGDNPNFWNHDHTDPTNPPDYPPIEDWGYDHISYPIDSGYWHYTNGGNAIPPKFIPQGGPGLEYCPDIYFMHPHLRYTPTRSQSTLIGTFTAGRPSTINDIWYELEGEAAGKNSLTCDTDVYIAKKPYLQFDIPGLTIQRSGEAEVDMSTSMMQALLKESTLRPGFWITQRREWVLRTVTYRWFDLTEIIDEDVVDVQQHQVAFDGFLILRLEMYGLQESSKGGIVEGWGRLYETGSAGVTEAITPEKDWPDMPTDYEKPEGGGGSGDDWGGSNKKEAAEDMTEYYLYHVDKWNATGFGWGSTPRFRPAQTDHKGIQPYDCIYGSRLFRVWFDPNADPIVIHCEDDVYDLRRYGLMLGNSIYRYDIVNRENGGVAGILHSTREDEDFCPGMTPGATPGWDPYISGPEGAAIRRAMNQDYKDAKKCVMSFTWVEDELVAAVEMYDQQWGSSFSNHGRKFEIATLDPVTGVFDNARANMIFAEPGRMFTKARSLLDDRAVYTVGSPYLEQPIWDFIDPYQYEHWRYGGWAGVYTGYDEIVIEDDEDYGVYAFSIFSYSPEVSDMWPKIVYTNIA